MAETLAAGGKGGRSLSCFQSAAHALPHDRNDREC